MLKDGSLPDVWGEKLYYFKSKEIRFKYFIEAKVGVLKDKGVCKVRRSKRWRWRRYQIIERGFWSYFGAWHEALGEKGEEIRVGN